MSRALSPDGVQPPLAPGPQPWNPLAPGIGAPPGALPPPPRPLLKPPPPNPPVISLAPAPTAAVPPSMYFPPGYLSAYQWNLRLNNVFLLLFIAFIAFICIYALFKTRQHWLTRRALPPPAVHQNVPEIPMGPVPEQRTAFTRGLGFKPEEIVLLGDTALYREEAQGSLTPDRTGAARECVVCLVEYRDGDMLRHLYACGHSFHQGCVDAWLSTHTSCPLCRTDLRPWVPEQGSSQGSTAAQGTGDTGATFQGGMGGAGAQYPWP